MQRLPIGKRFGSVSLLATITSVNKIAREAGEEEEEGAEVDTEAEEEEVDTEEEEEEIDEAKREVAMNRNVYLFIQYLIDIEYAEILCNCKDIRLLY